MVKASRIRENQYDRETGLKFPDKYDQTRVGVFGYVLSVSKFQESVAKCDAIKEIGNRSE